MKKTLIIIAIFYNSLAFGQNNDFPIQKEYPFVKYSENKFIFQSKNNQAFRLLFNKLDSLIIFGQGQINIIQLGASHTQADIFTAELREQLQNIYPDLSAGRGYVFPYNLIKTNSPSDYNAFHSGNWKVCRNVEHKKCLLGLTGISATTFDTNASISIKLKNAKEIDQKFNHITILHSTDSCSYKIKFIPQKLVKSIHTYEQKGYSEIYLNKFVDKLTIKVQKTNKYQNKFSLYGIFLKNQFPGIIFDPIGINGAGTYSYNKCQLFEKQIKIINPDWLIIALGTNDGYTSKFNENIFARNLSTLIHKIKSSHPNIAITIIVPNDDYYRNRYANPNTAKEEKIIMQIAKQENCAVWDMYKIMGGYNSSSLWLRYGLMRNDRIHFTQKGYKHLADLFFTAFIDAYANSKQIK